MEIPPVKNEELALELQEIKFLIHAVAEKQVEDSIRTDEVYDRVFKNGMVSDIEKTKIQVANIEGWKKSVNKVVLSVLTAIILAGIGLVFFGNTKGLSFTKFFN